MLTVSPFPEGQRVKTPAQGHKDTEWEKDLKLSCLTLFPPHGPALGERRPAAESKRRRPQHPRGLGSRPGALTDMSGASLLPMPPPPHYPLGAPPFSSGSEGSTPLAPLLCNRTLCDDGIPPHLCCPVQQPLVVMIMWLVH